MIGQQLTADLTVRPVAAAQPTVADMLGLLATLPPGTRSKEDIDRQIADDRSAGTATEAYLDACCLIYLPTVRPRGAQ